MEPDTVTGGALRWRERARSLLGSVAFYLVALTVSYTAFYAFSRNLTLHQRNYLPLEFNRKCKLSAVTALGPGVTGVQLMSGDTVAEINGLIVTDRDSIRKALAASRDGVTALRWLPHTGGPARRISWVNVPAMPHVEFDRIQEMTGASHPLFQLAGVPPEAPLIRAAAPMGAPNAASSRGRFMLHLVFSTPGSPEAVHEVVLALIDRRIPWGLYCLAVSFCVLGVLVYRLQPESSRARGFFYFCSYMALFYFTRSIHPFYRDLWDRLLLDHLMGLAPIPTTLFVATFTPMRFVLNTERKTALLALSATGALLILQGMGHTTVFIFAWLVFIFASLSSSIAASLWVILRPGRVSARERQSGMIYLMALGLAFIPYSLYMGARIITGAGAEMQMLFEVLPFVFPFIIGYAIMRHNLLNVHELALQGLLFTALAAFLVTGYGLVVGVVVPLVEKVVLTDSRWIIGAGVALLVLASMPVYQMLRRRLEGRFEKGLARYDALIRDIELARADEREASEFCATTLQRIARITETPDGAIVRRRSGPDGGRLETISATSPEFVTRISAILSSAGEFTNDSAAESVVAGADAAAVPVLLPIRHDAEGEVLLALGEKIGRRAHGWHELAKLRQAARAIALALHGFDIRERMREKARLEAELLQSQKLEALGALAGGITHDFNNLLLAISSFTTLANDAIPSDHPAHSALNNVEEAARQARSLTGSLLRYVRPSAGAPAPVDFARLIREAAEMLRRLLPSAIRLDVRTPDGPVMLGADEGQLYQVVMNLVLNARDAMPDGGTLSIALSRTGETGREIVRLEVGDSGCGMTPRLRARIFDPGFTTKSPDRGAGLGLAIVRRIVATAHGKIEVHSEPGEGTRFIVDFPAGAPPDLPIPVPAPSGELLIAILMPDPVVARVLASRIKLRGWRAKVLKSPAELADPACEMPDGPDALVADAAMLRDGAGELLRRHPELPVLFMGDDLEEALGGARATRAHYLSKPCSVEQLIEGISLILGPARAPAEPSSFFVESEK